MLKLSQKFLNKKIIFISFFVLLAALFLLPCFCLAAGVDVGAEYGEATGLSDTDPRIILARIVQIFLGFLGIVAVGLIIYGGFLWMTSAGSEEKIDKAKKILRNTIIGLVIILSAFAIASFVLNRLLGATGFGGGGGPPGTTGGGTGVLGSCVVESVYPEPNQKEVPRNTSIIVTFKEEMDSTTICGSTRCQGDNILTNGQVKIYKTNDDPSNFLTDVLVYDTTDRKTFVFVPGTYLGSPSEYFWYTVYLSNDILKADGDQAFDTCRTDFLEWQFEVSNKIDLTPPQVEQNGVFPPPDNGQDQIVVSSNSVRATGTVTVTVSNMLDVYSPATTTGNVRPGGNSNPAVATIDKDCLINGTLTITASTSHLIGELSHGQTLLGSASFSNGQIVFDNYLTLDLSDPVNIGNFWDVDVVAKKEADTLTVGSVIYVFTDNPTLPNHIDVGANNNDTATNIAQAVNNHPDVTTQLNGLRVDIEATVAGKTGNNIVLDTTNRGALQITPMSGGTDRRVDININDKKDQPMNSAIQINFNEAVLPITVSGNADDVSDYIRVIDLADPNNYMAGKFVISNGYKTVEFLSDNQCGVNGCGEPIYCLPKLSNIRVELVAAGLVICAGQADCAAKSPYNTCNVVCQDSDGNNYPTADIGAMDGVMDAAFNSLDGNRDENTQGPVSYFNENSPNALDGDNFVWSFFISDQMDITPPIIEVTSPPLGGYNNMIASMQINFSKLMMSSSLHTGYRVVFDGQKDVVHKSMNLWSLAGRGVGFWTGKEDVDSDLDGQFDKTRAFIKHNMLSESTSYRAQVGSATRDIYQNCFKPSAGPACMGVNNTNPSCCNGVVTATLDNEGNCP